MNLEWKTVLILFAAMAIVLAACGGGAPVPTPTPTEPPGDPVAGKKAYDGTCIACHGADLKGMPGLGKDLTTSEFVRSKTNTELVEFVKIGRPASDPANTQGVDMPPKGGNPALTDQDILNIVAYIRSMQVP